jgi:ankyrin repeat protein
LQFPDLALRTSCEFGKYELVKLILSSFPHPAITLVDKNRALKNSSELAIVKLLVENGADVTIDDNYPMYRACTYGNYDVVEYLIQNGATITTHAFCAASKGGHLDLLRLLIRHGAVPSATSVEQASLNLHLRTVNFLLGFEGIKLEQTFVDQMLEKSSENELYFDGFIGHQKKLEKLKLTNEKVQRKITQIEITKLIKQYYKNASSA